MESPAKTAKNPLRAGFFMPGAIYKVAACAGSA
jgi:hypothetical protein